MCQLQLYIADRLDWDTRDDQHRLSSSTLRNNLRRTRILRRTWWRQSKPSIAHWKERRTLARKGRRLNVPIVWAHSTRVAPSDTLLNWHQSLCRTGQCTIMLATRHYCPVLHWLTLYHHQCLNTAFGCMCDLLTLPRKKLSIFLLPFRTMITNLVAFSFISLPVLLFSSDITCKTGEECLSRWE